VSNTLKSLCDTLEILAEALDCRIQNL